MRIAIVCQGLPHRTLGASLVLYYEYIRAILLNGDDALLVLIDPDGRPIADSAIEILTSELETFGTIKLSRMSANPTRARGLVKLSSGRDLSSEVCSTIASFEPDVVLCFDIAAASVCAISDVPKVVWLGDLDFETVTYHTKLAIEEGSLRFDRLALLPYRVGLLKNFYKAALQGADIVVASKSSEVSLAKMGLVAKYLPYPWPSPVVSPNRSYTPGAVPRLLFSGTLQALGSRSAFHMLLNELYPLMRVKFGADGFELLLTGAGELPVWVRESVAAKPEIQFLGFVPDLIEVMDSCSAFLAPINVPVGNRSRILTAMAARIPVVAHASTAMGNPLLVDGVTCLLADSAPKFVHQLEKLLADATLAENIAGSARHAYLKNHQPSHATGMLIAHLSAAAAGR